MNLAPGSITALTTAQPGWTVTVTTHLSDETRVETCPIVAWAVVLGGPEPDDEHPYTEVEPAFIYDGSVAVGRVPGAVVEINPPEAS